MIDDYPTRETSRFDFDAAIPRLLLGADAVLPSWSRLLTGSGRPRCLPRFLSTSNMHATSVNDDTPANRRRTSPLLSSPSCRAHLLRSSGRARRLVGEGEACCCSAVQPRDFEACSSFPRLVRACARVSPSFSRRRLSLFLLKTQLQHPSPFHSRVPARPDRELICVHV